LPRSALEEDLLLRRVSGDGLATAEPIRGGPPLNTEGPSEYREALGLRVVVDV